MEQQETLDWATRQDVVKVRAFKKDEEDTFTFTVGEYMVAPLVFDTQEEAEQYLKKNLKLTNLDLAIISAIAHKINKLSEEQLNNEEV